MMTMAMIVTQLSVTTKTQINMDDDSNDDERHHRISLRTLSRVVLLKVSLTA